MTREEKREKELREVAHFHANKFSTRNGYTTPEEACIQTARWADAHQPNPWLDARTDQPKNDSTVLVLLEGGYRTMGFYRGKFWYAQRPLRNYYTRSGDVNYWMPIPELPKKKGG